MANIESRDRTIAELTTQILPIEELIEKLELEEFDPKDPVQDFQGLLAANIAGKKINPLSASIYIDFAVFDAALRSSNFNRTKEETLPSVINQTIDAFFEPDFAAVIKSIRKEPKVNGNGKK